MRTFQLLIFFIAGTFLFSSCENDFEVNADWKEVTIIYGLLEANDTVHYIKVNKAFLNENTSAIEIAQRMDSLYHNDIISVSLEEYISGSLTRGTALIRDTLLNKEPGTFHNPENILYRTPAGYTLNTNAEYIVRVTNPVKGTESFAHTTIVAPVRHVYPSASQQNINFSNYSPLQLNFRSGTNARFYDFDVIFHYREYSPGNPSTAEDKTISWKVFEYWTTNSLTVPSDISFKLDTEEFYKLLQRRLPADGSVREPGMVQFKYSAGGDEIYNYISINQSALGIVQKRSDYTNINNGYGIFSSRLRETISMNLSAHSIDSLVSGIHTKNLGFIR